MNMEEKKLFGYDLSAIKNINEELVAEMMETILKDDDTICRCQLCIEDIFALSLNKIKPLYVQSTFKESTFTGYDLTKILDRDLVGKAIHEAITKVTRNPHH
jgi:competence protein ComFB